MLIAKTKFTLNAVLGLSLVLSLGCDQSKTASNLTTTVSTAQNLCSSPTTQIIDYGRKATSGTSAGLRGSFSDMAMNPSTAKPAMVFTDAGSLTLKYSYWNGSDFKYEIIASGLTTNYPRLVFLSTGRPLVFWSNGATAIYMASRDSASHSSSSTWTISTIDNVATMTTRAVEASVNANDQVGVFYISAASTVARFVGCSANCQTASNYTGMGVIGNYITNTASASANSADIKWCNTGSGYTPYVVYGGSSSSTIARCTSTTVSDCATPANWQSTSITDGTVATGANQVTTKLSIASGTDGAFTILAKTSSNELRIYQQNAGGCSSGALAISSTSRQVASGANLGNAFGLFAQDSSNRFHVVVNEAQTNIRYFNELTGSAVAAWNSVGNVETVGAAGIPAAGSTRGGMLLDEANDQLLITYGRTNAVTPTLTYGNLVLAYSNCPSGGTGCGASTLASPSSAAGLIFGNSPIDMTGQLALTTGQITKPISTAATSLGRPASAYLDFSVGSNTTGRIKYAYRSGSSASDTWLIEELPNTVSPQTLSLAFDHLDRPWIAYYDASSLKYYLATNSQTNGSGTWATYQFPLAAATAPTLPAVNAVALAMYYSGGVAKPVMIVSNSGAATKIVRSAMFNWATESWSNNVQVDSGTANTSKLTADFDTSGNIVLAYYDTTNNGIRYTASSNGGSTWATPTSIFTLIGGMGLEIKLNPTTSKPALAFMDRANNLMRYRECTSVAASCITSANWTTIGSGVLDAATGVSTLTAAATDGLLSAGLAFTSAGKPWVIYPTGSLSSAGTLNYSYSSTDIGGYFTTPATLSSSYNAITSTPVVATPANFGLGGWAPSSVMTTNGSLHTVYIGPGNYLYSTSCGD